MPDHLHALIQFQFNQGLSTAVGSWKRYHAQQHDVRWQANFFDHRIRNDDELDEKAAYIRRNPVVKGLCGEEEMWPFLFCGDF